MNLYFNNFEVVFVIKDNLNALLKVTLQHLFEGQWLFDLNKNICLELSSTKDQHRPKDMLTASIKYFLIIKILHNWCKARSIMGILN